jgi:hypothetical protein
VYAIDEARCKNYYPSSRFQLTSADLDFQTLVDKDGTLEVLVIFGLAGELDKQVTSEAEFTYSVPTPFGVVRPTQEQFSEMVALSKKPKTNVNSATSLGDAIAAAIKQMSAGLGDFAALSQHQVKVNVKFAFTKDGAVELEPKWGPLSIVGKYKDSRTVTQTLTLTFTDQAPTVNLSVTPSSPISEGVSVILVASVVPPASSTVTPQGNVTFLDSGNTKLSDPQPLKDGFAGIIIPTLKPGVHSFTAVYSPTTDGPYDSAASTATVMVVTQGIVAIPR